MTKHDSLGGASYRSLCFELLEELKNHVGTSHPVVVKTQKILKPSEVTFFKRGEDNHAAVLTPELVRHMRKMREDGWSYRDLAYEFDVDVKHAWRICKGKCWAWVK